MRLTQTEVAAFAADGAIEEMIEFGLTANSCLVYRLEQAPVEFARADFTGGKITISVPLAEAGIWVKSNQIGIKTEQDLGA